MLRALLSPLSLFYAAAVRLRNSLYDHNILCSRPSSLPSVCVGNLAVGGTGKTPHSEYLLRTLNGRKAYVSRGYKRHSKGMIVANDCSTSLDLGDEAFQIHSKFSDVIVVVDSDRHRAVDYLKSRGDVDVVILDDAFQHRNIRATRNVIITDYDTNPRSEGMLPAGRMRDEFRSMRRADIIVVSKTPADVSDQQLQQKIREVRPDAMDIPVVFTSLQYGLPYNPIAEKTVNLSGANLLLFTGIAKPEPLANHLLKLSQHLQCMSFPDHHNFSSSDIDKILSHSADYYVTTEKDFARLSSHPDFLARFSNRLAVIPIEISELSSTFSDAENCNLVRFLTNSLTF